MKTFIAALIVAVALASPALADKKGRGHKGDYYDPPHRYYRGEGRHPGRGHAYGHYKKRHKHYHYRPHRRPVIVAPAYVYPSYGYGPDGGLRIGGSFDSDGNWITNWGVFQGWWD